ncbi:aldehyde dehydrogenase [Aquihabitans sp. G128]|uniref:aldehyde dehydrogenase n=1 Tax=Aquihabitans sp. G128 TaxID=2849779 RepID=UPI0020B32675|nr:aldehyde dehydrogenase [Aquihabitans sp. G128]
MSSFTDGLDVNLIDGKLVPASGGGTFETLNPATEEVLGAAADGTGADLDAAIGAARRAFDTTDWSTDPAFRARCLRQLQAGLTAHVEELRELTIAEVGAPRFLTTFAQLEAPIADLGYVADLAESYEWQTDLGAAKPAGVPSHRYLLREATGVVGAITPWNFPNQINLAKVGPALASGCTVVLKPPPDTPWIAAALARIAAEETDLPPGVFNVVNSSDHAIGAQLSTDPRVDLVSFTGSTATGRKVMASAAETLKKVFLELGGKSAFIVLDDADLAGAAGLAAFTACTHAGQGCAITTRLLVPRAQYDEAVEATAATMSMLAAGDPQDSGTVCGPVISARQRDRIEGYLRLAQEEGGSFATGGGRPADRDKGFFIEPTLITGLDNSSRVAQEEIFGPVLVILPHDGDDDAVRIANDSPYGLSGAVQSGDVDRAWAVARKVRTGTMGVNGGVWYGGDVPFGGYKASGIGRESGVLGFEEYLEAKSVAVGL